MTTEEGGEPSAAGTFRRSHRRVRARSRGSAPRLDRSQRPWLSLRLFTIEGHQWVSRTLGLPKRAAAAIHRENASLFTERGAQAARLERAVPAAPDRTAARAALDDRGVVAETLGETVRALAVFLELRAASDAFSDIPQRIDRLTRLETGG